MASGVRFREANTCMLYPLVFNCRGVVVGMLCVPSLWLLLGCMRIGLIRSLYALFLDERGIYHYLLQLTSAGVLCVYFV